ncbi:GAF domain-containing protein [Agaribacterium haliotis]|uniref:GAF domain-containing protein n=1 Tax=Agaribacterium haliotis TaxID=2013869 RepID=UPI0019572C0B|nr:GAF domain-containing protein [Agaribacterium haliotis]
MSNQNTHETLAGQDPEPVKAEVYKQLIKKLESLMQDESDFIANVSNLCALLHAEFDFHWVGIYRVVGKQLVLGPFQGPVACTRIDYGKGVCGQAWKQQRALIVDDVDAFPGHIACSALSRSEIVLPIFGGAAEVLAILDIDDRALARFDDTDRLYLEQCLTVLTRSSDLL